MEGGLYVTEQDTVGQRMQGARRSIRALHCRHASHRRGAGTGLKEQIVGAWSPVSQHVEQDGKRVEPFGNDLKGIVIYQADGHFVLYLQKASSPRFASNNRLTGTVGERAARQDDLIPGPCALGRL